MPSSSSAGAASPDREKGEVEAVHCGTTLENYVLPFNLRMNYVTVERMNQGLAGMEVIKVSKVR